MTDTIQKYIDYGFQLIPLDGKKPIKQDWPNNGTRDIETIAGWLKEGSNIGILTGLSSGIVVLDIDGDQGRESLYSLNQSIKTFTVSTGKGTHYYFRTDQVFKNRVGILNGVDIRADRGQVVAPPSIHPETGTQYKIICDIPPADLPEWLIQLMTNETEELKPEKNGKQTFLTQKYDGGVISSGKRYDTLFRIGCSMRAKNSEMDEIYSYLSDLNNEKCDPPLDKDEIEKIAYDSCRFDKGPNHGFGTNLYKNADNTDLVIRGNIFEYFRTNTEKKVFHNSVMIYLALEQITSLNNGENVFNYTKFLSSNYMIYDRSIPSLMEEFEKLGLIRIVKKRAEGKFQSKEIEFTPNNFNSGK